MGNEIKEATFKDALYCAKALVGLEACEECRFYRLGDLWCDDTYRIMHEALEEIQQYRAIGTVEELKTMKENGAFTGVELAQILAMQMELKKYQSVGTIEEFNALKEKNEPKKTIQDEHFEHDYICSCCGGKLAESVDDNCCLEEEMAGWCPYCGQAIDWK